jgi:glycosyltransferase involved in cell wall biosynthesis
VPLLSVLTPATKERAGFTAEAGESLAGQVLPEGWELEWVVQEDGAEPGLGEVVGGFPFARYEANGRQFGLSTTRNIALSRVRGALVLPLDCDDLILPGGLAVAIEAFAAYPQIHWVANQADDLLPDGSRVPFPLPIPPGLVEPGVISTRIGAYEKKNIHAVGVTMRVVTVRALGGWVASPRAEDNALVIAITELTPGYLTPRATWLYRKHDGQITREPAHLELEPTGMRIVCQRLAAIREVGLGLGYVDAGAGPGEDAAEA